MASSNRQQSQVASALDGGGQLTLLLRVQAADAGRNDFAIFSDEALKGVDFFVIKPKVLRRAVFLES